MTYLRPLQPYPLRVLLKPDESLKGLMHRLQERNGIAYFNWLVADVGIRNMTTTLSQDHLTRLSLISGLSVEELRKHQGGRRGDLHSLLGHRLTMSMVEKGVSRVCVECLREDPYHRLAWDFAPLAVCPVHATQIIGACPQCKQPLHWRRNKFIECGNGHNVLECSKTPQRVPIGDLSAMRAFSDILLGRKSNNDLLRGLSLSDGELPLIDFVCMLDLLGSMKMETIPAARIGTRSWYSQHQYYLITNQAYLTATDWPGAFHRALADLGPRNEPSLFLIDTKDPRRKRLHIALRHYRDRPFAKVIAREIGEYATQNRISMMPGAFGLRHLSPKGSLISATKASRLMRTMKVDEIAKRERWIGYRQIGDGRNVMLRRADVEQWIQQDKARLVTTKEIRRMLHVTPRTILAMRDRGLFGEEARVRRTKVWRTGTEGGGWHALPAELEQFQQRFSGLPKKMPKTSWGEYTDWISFKRRYTERSEFEFADALSGVASGNVRAVLADIKQLSKIKFKMSDLCAFANKDLIELPSIDAPVEFSPHAAIKRFRITWYGLQRAVSLGILPVRETAHRNPQFWIGAAAMDEFLSRFATAAILAGKHRKTPSSIGRILTKMNVRPFLDDKGRFREAKIYELKAIEEAGLDAVLRSAADAKHSIRRSKAAGNFALPRS